MIKKTEGGIMQKGGVEVFKKQRQHNTFKLPMMLANTDNKLLLLIVPTTYYLLLL